jgi:hypothetical protein
MEIRRRRRIQQPEFGKNIVSARPGLNRLRLGLVDETAQILAGVSNNHRLAGFGQHRYRKAATHCRNFSDARRNAQSAQLNRRHPQIYRCGFCRGGEAFLNLKFSGHECFIATRMPEKPFERVAGPASGQL